MPAVLEKDTALSAFARPRRNRLSFRIPENLGNWDFRVFMIPVRRESVEHEESELVGRLDSLRARYGSPDWDGYGAKPISQESLAFAKGFARAIPESFAAPDVGVDADGEVTFEWYHAADNQCSLTFSSSGKVYCIVRASGERLSATIPVASEDRIVDLVTMCG